jgi:predicted transcriptional regulator
MKQRPTQTEQEVELSPEELAELDAAMEEAERGEGMDAFEFLRQLRDGTWRDSEVRLAAMRGTFSKGRIEVDGESYPDGTAVNFVVVREPEDEQYELTPEEEDALEQSIAEIARGECVTAEQLFAELRAIRLRNDG